MPANPPKNAGRSAVLRAGQSALQSTGSLQRSCARPIAFGLSGANFPRELRPPTESSVFVYVPRPVDPVPFADGAGDPWFSEFFPRRRPVQLGRTRPCRAAFIEPTDLILKSTVISGRVLILMLFTQARSYSLGSALATTLWGSDGHRSGGGGYPARRGRPRSDFIPCIW